MIRRWSRVTKITFNPNEGWIFYKKHLFKSLRKTILFRKFIRSGTYFNRYSGSKLKHKYEWAPYRQILARWTQDFYFHKNNIKFQYLKNFSDYMFLIFNPTYFVTKRTRLFAAPKDVLHNYISFKNYYYYTKFNIFKWMLFKKNSHQSLISYGYLLETFDILNVFSKPLILLQADNQTFAPNAISIDTISQHAIFFTIRDLLANTSIQFYLEYYKVLKLLWYVKIFTVK